MKRLISLFVALLLLFAMAPSGATVEQYYYDIKNAEALSLNKTKSFSYEFDDDMNENQIYDMYYSFTPSESGNYEFYYYNQYGRNNARGVSSSMGMWVFKSVDDAYLCENELESGVGDNSYSQEKQAEWGVYKLTKGKKYYINLYYWGTNPKYKDYSIKIVKHTQHSYQYDYGESVPATTYSVGKAYYNCDYCDTIKKEAIPKLKKPILSKKKFVYNGKVQKPAFILKNTKGAKIACSAEYWNDNGRKCNSKNVGSYYVQAVSKNDKYDYCGEDVLFYTIVPKGTTISKLTTAKKALSVKWNKQATQTTGYQIQYSTNKSFKSGNKLVTVSKNKIISRTIKKLKAKRNYYVRIRTYKTVGGKRYCSSWSAAKVVKTK